MPQHDYVIDNGPGVAVRADFNAVLQAIVSNNSGPIEPVTKFAGMLWFDTSEPSGPGIIRLRTAANDGWMEVPTGSNFVPSTGGDITGDLSVAGEFSNPEFDSIRVSHAGTTAPTDPLAGMLWFDTSVTPAVMRVRNAANSAWVSALPTTNPTFTDSVTISSATALASLDLIAAGEKRRVVNDAAGNRLAFYAPGDVTMGYITDAGDLVTTQSGSLQTALAGKQASLGFTPVRQGGGAGMGVNVVKLGWSGSHLLAEIDTTAIGYIYTTLDPPPAQNIIWQRGDVGAVSFANTPTSAPAWPGNGTRSGVGLRYGWDGEHESSGDLPGTWRNLGGTTDGDINFICQRTA